MSFCCLPKLNCFKSKSRIRTQSENSKIKSRVIEKSFSYESISQIKVSKNISMTVNRSFPDVIKNLNVSRGSSYRSIIAVRCADKFEIIDPNLRLKKDKIPSLDVSKISNVSFSDHSSIGITKELQVAEKDIVRSGKGKRSNRKALEFIKSKKTEAPPMFLINPCFGSRNSTMQKSDNNN